MKTRLVQITHREGSLTKDPSYHAVLTTDGSPRTLCYGEAFEYGDVGEYDVKYKEKSTGFVTCPQCIEILKELGKYKWP